MFSFLRRISGKRLQPGLLLFVSNLLNKSRLDYAKSVLMECAVPALSVLPAKGPRNIDLREEPPAFSDKSHWSAKCTHVLF